MLSAIWAGVASALARTSILLLGRPSFVPSVGLASENARNEGRTPPARTKQPAEARPTRPGEKHTFLAYNPEFPVSPNPITRPNGPSLGL
jgi:hypothetical protein